VACALVRPETPLVLLGSLSGVLVVEGVCCAKNDPRRRKRRNVLGWMLALSTVMLALMTWRFHAFGLMFPNSAVAKIGGFSFPSGLRYLATSVGRLGATVGVLWIVGVLGVAAKSAVGKTSSVLNLATLFSALQIGFVGASGRDWMPAGRLLVPATPAIVLLVIAALNLVRIRSGGVALLTFFGLLAHEAVCTHRFATDRGNASLPVWYRMTQTEEQSLVGKYAKSEILNRGHRRDAWLLESLVPLIREYQARSMKPITLMSGQAGMIPYYVFREFYGTGTFVDLYSLTSRAPGACIPERYKREVIHGVLISPRVFLNEPETLRHCGIERPNVWFSTGEPPNDLDQLGFRLVYRSAPSADKAWAAVAW
jgi:hypothetical protein